MDWNPSQSDQPTSRAFEVKPLVRAIFRSAGWRVSDSDVDAARHVPDLIVSRRDIHYAVAVKYASEGRIDRLIPLWSQAFLQGARYAGPDRGVLAMVVAPRISPHTAEQVLAFAAEWVPGSAAGVADLTGLRMFQGNGLEALNHEPVGLGAMSHRGAVATDLFSDLNQWLLKVLLAPEIPESLLSAPRGRYRNARQLATAAGVSAMSASRFVRELRNKGFLRDPGRYLQLIRREELLQQWQSAAGRRVKEAPFVFLLRGNPRDELTRLLPGKRACLALFAAADSLGLGFVTGVAPHVYVERLGPETLSEWSNVIAAEPHEAPDFFVRQAPAPASVFRGAVKGTSGVLTADVLQVWLDVGQHPTRGREQADLIRQRVLDRVIAGGEE